jgi:predicted nucleic acid-binding protein
LNVLVDTSVWVGHFKQRNEHLVELLEAGMVLCHPHVVVEVACGTPPHRRAILAMLAALESGPVATHDELLGLIERRAPHGRGCGFVDVSLLASALLGQQTFVWTLDRRLESMAADVRRSYRPTLSS